MNYSAYIDDLAEALKAISEDEIEGVRSVIADALGRGACVFVAGNGGSAATASHMACDFQKTTLAKEHGRVMRRIRCMSLADNVPVMTAWGNDVAYDEIFAQQLRTFAREQDLLLVISASGNSPNILKTLEAARELHVETIGLLGFEGGKALTLCDHTLLVRSQDYGIIEDAHSVLMHMLTAALRPAVLGA